MKNVERIIKQIATENFKLYPECYPINNNRTATDEATENVKELAKGYFRERNDFEIERDEKAGITEEDYIEWVKEAFELLIVTK